jgi:hypothetical protein
MAAELILTTNIGNDCLLCNCRPVNEDSREREVLPMIHHVGGDVNWGEQVNICMVCAGVIADLLDRPDKDKVEKLKEAHTNLKSEHAELVAEHEKQKLQIDKYVKGRKAEKELTNA